MIRALAVAARLAGAVGSLVLFALGMLVGASVTVHRVGYVMDARQVHSYVVSCAVVSLAALLVRRLAWAVSDALEAA